MRALNVLLAIVVSVVLALLVFEAGLRLIGLGPPETLNQPDARLGWSKVPGRAVSRKTGEYSIEIAINELGLRDDRQMSSPAKADGVYRVVMLGDSFTLGFAVDRQDLFVDQLERWWRAENRRVEAINTGTEGYSTDQEVAWLQEHGPDFRPDLVLLFPYENDLYWNGQATYVGQQPKPLFEPDGQRATGDLPAPPEKPWTDEFAITRLFRNRTPAGMADHLFTPKGAAGPMLKEWQAVVLGDPDPLGAETLARTRGALRALKSTCEELDAACVVVPIPSHSAVDPAFADRFGKARLSGLPRDRWSPDKPVDTFLRLAREEGLQTLDPRPTFKALMRNDVALYYDVDWHLNPVGNAEFASFLHLELDSLGLFPSQHRPTEVVASLPEAPKSQGGRTWPKVYGVLWLALTALYFANYRDEPAWQPPVKVAALLGLVFGIVLGGQKAIAMMPPAASRWILLVFVAGILGFVVYKLGRRVATILELVKAFVLRGHWYLLPLVVVLLTVGSLLVVAASSPLVAPFIYTLF